VTEVSPVSIEPVPQTGEDVDLRASIFAIDDIPVERVPVPEWGGIVIEVRGMTGGDRAAMMADVAENGSVDFSSMYADIIIKTSYNPATGARIFTDGDRASINAKSGLVVDRIAMVGMRLSGMSGEKAVDEAGKPS